MPGARQKSIRLLGFIMNMTLTPGRRMLIEWLVLTTVLVGLAVLAVGHASRTDRPWSSLHRSDALIFDSLLPLAAIAPSQSVVLIEIDQTSLDQLGRWPWRRNLHATLINQLVGSGVQTIGLDILFTEPTADDHLLAASIQNAAAKGVRMVMPISISRTANGLWYPLYPMPELGLNSLLGHANFRIDGDGLVRGQYLYEGGFPSFALQLLPPEQHPRVQAPAKQALAESTPSARDQAFANAIWPLKHFAWFSRLDAPLTRVSYIDVLRSDGVDQLKGKIVLVGATALGLGDQYANGLVGTSSLSAGVELHAAAIAALEQQKLIVPVDQRSASLLGAAIVLAVMLVLYRSSARAGLFLSVLIFASTIAAAALFLRSGHWWPPSSTLLLTAVAYPLWSWRRLEAATSGLVQQAYKLESEPMLTAVERRGNLPAEPVSRGIQLLQYAAQRSVELRQLLQATVQNLPHAAVLSDHNNRVVLRNEQFDKAFIAPFDAQPDSLENAPDWLSRQVGLTLGSHPDPAQPHAHEQSDKLGRDWLIDTVPMTYPDGRRWTLIQMVDLSPIRAAQREREQTLRFLSHDLRTPLLSILTIMREQKNEESVPLWQDRIDLYAQRSLELADGFVQLARAENQAISNEIIDYVDLMIEANDLSWAVARERNIRLISVGLPPEALITGDPQLIRRALVNLIENAIKFSPPGAEVQLTLERITIGTDAVARQFWCAAVADHGKGLSGDELKQVFEPFWRSQQHEHRAGAGLGLTFVRVVAERHRGTVCATAISGGGARFELRLPVA